MGKTKVAIATKGNKGLSDEVADFFAKAQTFTIATVEGKRAHIEVIKNQRPISHVAGAAPWS
ncbi:MAG: hypothetical protein ACUVQM_06905 [Candidatus Hadarchaeaceae archaeon]